MFSILSNCQNKESNKSYEMNNTQLIDGISINDNSLFAKEEISLKKYRYKDKFLEDIYISDLLDKKYREEFIKYLVEDNNDELKSSLITQLLIIRIYQLKDEQAFNILLALSKNENISYNGIELYDMVLTRILVENPQFFIEQCYKNQDADFLKYIVSLFNQYFANKEFLELNMGYVETNGGELLLYPEIENTFGTNFKEKIKTLPKMEIVFSPSLYTDWKNKTIFFTDISSAFGKQITDKLSVGASVYYKIYVLPELNKYIFQKSENKVQNKVSSIDNDEMIGFMKKEIAKNN